MQVGEQVHDEVKENKQETEEAVTRTVAEKETALEEKSLEETELDNETQGQANELQAQVSSLLQIKYQIFY